MNQQAPNSRHAATAQAMDAAGKEIAAYHLALVLDGPAAKPALANLLRSFADTIAKSA